MRSPQAKWAARITVVVAAIAAAMLCDTAGWGSASVAIPGGNPHSGERITVTGSGFPAHSADPTGIQILECADPGGSSANLPSNALLCDGTTVNPTQINTDANGNFSATYTVYALDGTHTSNIWCDRTHACVLWVGVDYNQDFLGPHAFSSPFEVGGASSSGGSAGLAVTVVVVAVALAGAVGVLRVRARRRTRARVA